MQRPVTKITTQALMVYLCLAVAGCTSYHPVTFEPQLLAQQLATGNLVRPGDRIRVTTMDGEKVDITVTALSDDALISDGRRLPFADIAQIETRTYSATRTGALVGGLTAGYVVLLTVALSSVAFLP